MSKLIERLAEKVFQKKISFVEARRRMMEAITKRGRIARATCATLFVVGCLCHIDSLWLLSGFGYAAASAYR